MNSIDACLQRVTVHHSFSILFLKSTSAQQESHSAAPSLGCLRWMGRPSIWSPSAAPSRTEFSSSPSRSRSVSAHTTRQLRTCKTRAQLLSGHGVSRRLHIVPGWGTASEDTTSLLGNVPPRERPYSRLQQGHARGRKRTGLQGGDKAINDNADADADVLPVSGVSLAHKLLDGLNHALHPFLVLLKVWVRVEDQHPPRLPPVGRHLVDEPLLVLLVQALEVLQGYAGLLAPLPLRDPPTEAGGTTRRERRAWGSSCLQWGARQTAPRTSLPGGMSRAAEGCTAQRAHTRVEGGGDLGGRRTTVPHGELSCSEE